MPDIAGYPGSFGQIHASGFDLARDPAPDNDLIRLNLAGNDGFFADHQLATDDNAIHGSVYLHFTGSSQISIDFQIVGDQRRCDARCGGRYLGLISL